MAAVNQEATMTGKKLSTMDINSVETFKCDVLEKIKAIKTEIDLVQEDIESAQVKVDILKDLVAGLENMVKGADIPVS
jgi:hypothetical protein